ncbi:hypothetical protein [Lewinella sp. IMCC34191]|uniref:hypothetical protein n=1 Tax=Lewinella sp. IMCC34191 TaxID=2259172 RepID=UPI000E259B1F|nr:hypothetical protein [Lewinella sp. IMCC34191]
MNGNTPSPTRTALQAAGGILLAASCVYLLLHGTEILAGNHYVDWSLVRALCLIGFLTLTYSFYEVHTAMERAR